jgi:hypothetical protein
MMMGGFAPFIFLAAIGDPVLIGSGIGVGLVIRRWWHMIPGGLVPPAAYLLLYPASLHFTDSLPFLYVGGLIWTATAFAVKRLWTR